jgi:hypothetical protein
MSLRSRSDLILARFPGPVTLYRSRLTWFLTAIGSGLFVAVGFWMVAVGGPIGWPILVFFTSCMIISAVMLLPGAGALKLDGDGFQITSLFRRHHACWQDVSEFETMAPPPPHNLQRFVVYDDLNQAGRMMAKLSVAVAGRNAGLPDTYGLWARDLALLMTRWREQALASRPGP